MFHEKHSRTIVKSITWRIVAFISSLIIIYFLTNNWNTALYHATIIHIVKTILYYIHERVWNLSNFGQIIKR